MTINLRRQARMRTVSTTRNWREPIRDSSKGERDGQRQPAVCRAFGICIPDRHSVPNEPHGAGRHARADLEVPTATRATVNDRSEK
jgi:hypothetical protein